MRYSFLLLFAILFNACRSQVAIPVTIPAPVDVPKEVKKIAFLDNTPFNDEDKPFIDALFGGGSRKNEQQAIDALINNFRNTLARAPRYRMSQTRSQAIRNGANELDWEAIQQLCEEQDAQLLVVLEWFDTNAPRGGAALSKLLGTGGYELRGQATFSIYFPLERYAIEYERFVESFMVGTSPSLDPFTMIADLNREQRLIRELAGRTGQHIAEYFFPLSFLENRFVWGGKQSLRQSKRILRRGDWALAAQQLDGLNLTTSTVESERLLLHRAIAAEGLGNLEAAFRYAEKAALIRSNPIAINYVQRLQERLEQQPRLQWQKKQAQQRSE